MSRISRRMPGVIFGSRIRSDESHQSLLPNRLAAPLFAANMMSFVAYVPQLLVMTLAIVGAAAGTWSLGVGLASAGVLLLVVVAQRTTMASYPGGGGDYQAAKHNLGRRTALGVAAGFMVDYTLTVALCLSMAVHMFSGVAPKLMPYAAVVAIVAVLGIMLVSMRGFSNSAWTTLVPTGLFVVVIGVLLIGAVIQVAMGNSITADSAGYGLTPATPFQRGVGAASPGAIVVLLAGGLGVGAAALAGVETVNNGMSVLNEPQHKNASGILLISTLLTFGLFSGVVILTWATGAVIVANPLEQLPASPAGYVQQPLLAQLTSSVFPGNDIIIWVTIIASALILCVAAMAVFISFPSLTRHVAEDGFLPYLLASRGRRLTHDGGIVSLGLIIASVLAVTQAQPQRLIALYALGTLWSFLIAQIAMVKHWKRHLAAAHTPEMRRQAYSGMWLAGLTAAVLAVLLFFAVVAKFTHGGWIVIAGIALLTVVMLSVGRHYARVKKRLANARWQGLAPARTHALVIVDGLHLPTRRALAYARAARPDSVEAIAVNVDDAHTRKLVAAWVKSELSVPLKVLEAPYRTMAGPVIRYIRRVREHNPRDVVNVYIPELVVTHWWEGIAHNEVMHALRHRLLREPGVSVTIVPFLLGASESDIEAVSGDHGDSGTAIVVSPETPEGEDVTW